MADQKITQLTTLSSLTTDDIFPIVDDPAGTPVTKKVAVSVLDARYQTLSLKGVANGYASLNSSGLIPDAQMPLISITNTFVVASQAAMLALTAEVGDVAVRSDQNKTYILRLAGASTLGNWQELLTPTDTVISVNSETGAVVLTTGDLTEDTNKKYVTDAQLVVISNTSGTNTGDQTDLTITASPASNITASGIKIALTAGQDLVFADVGYIKSDGKVGKADASVIATATAIVMALATISNNASGSFLLIGIARNDAWTWIVGGIIYLSETAGGLTQTAPTATDTVTQIIGVATHADRMYFNPQLVQVEHT